MMPMQRMILLLTVFLMASSVAFSQDYKTADRYFLQGEKEYDSNNKAESGKMFFQFLKEEKKTGNPRAMKMDDAYRILFFINREIENLNYQQFIRLSGEHLDVIEKRNNFPVVDVVNILTGLRKFETRKNHIIIIERIKKLMTKINPDDKNTFELLECEEKRHLKTLKNK